MADIHYIRGDATCPQAKGIKIICHICNDIGGWGKGFVLAISKRWEEPEQSYKTWYRDRKKNDFELGSVQFVQVERSIWVANMIAQRGIKTGSNGPPIRYESLGQCLQKLSEKATELKASVHMPRIGCGLAGGKWEMVEPLIIENLLAKDLVVTVYDYD